MKKNLLLAALAFVGFGAVAQETAPEFTVVKENPITSIKNQNQAGTCWCYSSLAFIESELLRMGKGEYDFSEMYIVHNTYLDRADKAVRTHGDISFSQGGSFYDVIYGMETFGLVPEAEMRPGVMYGKELSNHNELSAVSDAVVAAIAKGKHRSLQVDPEGQPLWKKAIEAVHDIYLGERPEKFTYNGKEYTPKSFTESLPINMDDYIEFTSYTHYPFYTTFALEVPDNWMWHEMYNIPMEEMMQCVDAALAAGHPIAWGTDVSEKSFVGSKAIGVIPEAVEKNLVGSDAEKWGKLSDAEKQAKINSLDSPMKEKTITQEMRQQAYDNYENTDDHGMVIVGTAVDQQGNPFFKVQNSWGESGPYKGFYYFSLPFFEYKTMDIMVNKNVVPKEILKKIGLK